jgi:hypothetical protein
MTFIPGGLSRKPVTFSSIYHTRRHDPQIGRSEWASIIKARFHEAPGNDVAAVV